MLEYWKLGSKVRPTPADELLDSYDFIVIGAGSAGAAVAARLSEDPEVTVLLLEAGGNDTGVVDIAIPAACAKLQHSEYDWGYFTEPQDNACRDFTERRSFWPRGKVLGGCSSINYMAYVRGCKADYDRWEAMGAAGWGFWDVFDHFTKAEDCRSTVTGKLNPSFHGYRGPVTNTLKRPVNTIASTFVDACVAMGYTEVDYHDPETPEGVALIQTNVRDGQRCSTAVGYLQPAHGRPNLHIAVNAHVHKIVVRQSGSSGGGGGDGGRKVAEAVDCILGKDRKVRSRRFAANLEVVLSAGAVNSPQILMLSGIGLTAELAEHGIKCVHNLPDVGQHLEDHVFVPLAWRAAFKGKSLGRANPIAPLTTAEKVEMDAIRDEGGRTTIAFENIGAVCAATSSRLGSLWLWLVHGGGPLSTSAYDAHLLCRTDLNAAFAGPDIQIGLFCGLPDKATVEASRPTTAGVKHLQDDWENKGLQGFCFVTTLLHPKSHGAITLRSSDPFDAPKIDPRYLSDPDDVQTLIRGMKTAYKIAKDSPAFNAIAECIIMNDAAVAVADSGKEIVDDDAFLEGFIRDTCGTLYHPGCTCKIGKVVDPNLRVYGIDHLRVIDASVMPCLPSGNTNAPTIMIGEKGAAMIAEAHNLNQRLETMSPPPSSVARHVAVFILSALLALSFLLAEWLNS